AKLAYLHGRGKGLPTDYAAAARWFREAAEQGHAEAQFNLGILYATGAGVERDRVQALMWLILADSAGVEAARERRRQIAAELSPPDVEEAEILADALRPVDAPPAPPSSKPSPVTSVSASLPAAWANRKAPPQRAPAPTAGSSAVLIHLASYRTPEAAASGWRRLRKAYADLLGKLDHSIVAVDLGAQGTFFRLQAGPLRNRNEAEALCARLKRHDLYCAPAF
ncbi:MAG: SEL1-like repeat protein, partial [Proteobacteria bacterium]|nr:SEL1-like repeat protein [Pseudomonadota bacterium]